MGLPQCTKKTPFMCIRHYKIREGQRVGIGEDSSLQLHPLGVLYILFTRTSNYTNHIRRGNGLFGNCEIEKWKNYTQECKFSDCHLQPLNIQSSTSSCCWKDMCKSAAAARGEQLWETKVWFFFNAMSFI